MNASQQITADRPTVPGGTMVSLDIDEVVREHPNRMATDSCYARCMRGKPLSMIGYCVRVCASLRAREEPPTGRAKTMECVEMNGMLCCRTSGSAQWICVESKPPQAPVRPQFGNRPGGRRARRNPTCPPSSPVVCHTHQGTVFCANTVASCNQHKCDEGDEDACDWLTTHGGRPEPQRPPLWYGSFPQHPGPSAPPVPPSGGVPPGPGGLAPVPPSGGRPRPPGPPPAAGGGLRLPGGLPGHPGGIVRPAGGGLPGPSIVARNPEHMSGAALRTKARRAYQWLAELPHRSNVAAKEVAHATRLQSQLQQATTTAEYRAAVTHALDTIEHWARTDPTSAHALRDLHA